MWKSQVLSVQVPPGRKRTCLEKDSSSSRLQLTVSTLGKRKRKMIQTGSHTHWQWHWRETDFCQYYFTCFYPQSCEVGRAVSSSLLYGWGNRVSRRISDWHEVTELGRGITTAYTQAPLWNRILTIIVFWRKMDWSLEISPHELVNLTPFFTSHMNSE